MNFGRNRIPFFYCCSAVRLSILLVCIYKNLGGICFLNKWYWLEKHTNLNCFHFFYIMNLIDPLSQQGISKEMPSSVAFSLTLFVGAVLGGIYLVEEIRRWKSVETRVSDLEESYHDMSSLQESQAETFQEYDERIREKKDYDSSEELEGTKYQAWHGAFEDMYRNTDILIYREKCSTIQKNEGWLAWDKTSDASTTVRDFYLGNSNPDFDWQVQNLDTSLCGTVSETLVNGWDSVIKIRITTTVPSEKYLLEFLQKDSYEGNLSWNLALKKAVDEKLITWSRILTDV
jgi:hypothetical protein